MRRIIHILVFFTLLSGLFALTGCSSPQEGGEEATPTPLPTPVKPTFTVELGDVTNETVMYGQAVPLTEQTASFSMDGVVANVYVKVNDTVEEGQLLADLTALNDMEAAWTAAVAEADAQQAANDRVIRRSQIALEMAQLELEDLKAKGASDYEIQIQQLKVELAQMDLDEIKADPALNAAANKVKEIEAGMVTAQLLAPVGGQIITAIEPGKSVRTSTTAFIIGDISQLEIGLTANEDQLQELSEGRAVTVAFEDQPDTPYTGVIRQLPYPYGSGSDEGSTVRVVLDAPASEGGYSVGDKVKATVLLERKTGVLWLPPEAIRTVGGRNFVVLDSASGAKRVDITLGVVSRTRVEIASGLSEGQVVVGP